MKLKQKDPYSNLVIELSPEEKMHLWLILDSFEQGQSLSGIVDSAYENELKFCTKLMKQIRGIK